MGDLDDPTRSRWGLLWGEVNPPARGPWGDNITVTQAIELLGSLKKLMADATQKKRFRSLKDVSWGFIPKNYMNEGLLIWIIMHENYMGAYHITWGIEGKYELVSCF